MIEVVVAVAFIAVFTVGMVGLAVAVLDANRQAKGRDIAVFLVYDRLETIRNTAYAGVTSANFPTEGYGAVTVGKPAVSFPEYQRSVSIQDDTPVSGMKHVVVTVAWRGGSVSGETLIGE